MEGVLNLFDLSLIYLFNTPYLCFKIQKFLTNNIFVMLEQFVYIYFSVITALIYLNFI